MVVTFVIFFIASLFRFDTTFRFLLTRHVFRGIGSGFKGVYAKLGGVWGHAPLQNFSNLGVQKCHFLRFSAGHFFSVIGRLQWVNG